MRFSVVSAPMATPSTATGSPPVSSPCSSSVQRRGLSLGKRATIPSFLASGRRPAGLSSVLSSPIRAAAAISVAAAFASQVPSLTALLSSISCSSPAPNPLAFTCLPPPACPLPAQKGPLSTPAAPSTPREVPRSPSSASAWASPAFSASSQSPCYSAFALPSTANAWEGRLFSVMPAAALSSGSRGASAAQAEGAGSLTTLAAPAHPAFVVTSQDTVPELHLAVTEYVHRKTGAHVVSLTVPSTEKEKVFCIAFRTPVVDSTGVPHILEHSVLSGSAKYPVKEPFAELLKGSLYSYLNASTYPDRTLYPVASANDEDFYNLANVYFDAVFQPRAVRDPDVLLQEGWRLEVTSEDEKEAADAVRLRGEDEAPRPRERRRKLAYQGVVLNEMKGVYSSPEALLWKAQMQTLFPDIPAYFHDSGGDPEVIKTLSFDDFVAFYNRFYHPSNARIFFWGSDNVLDRLNFVDRNLNNLQVPKTCDRAVEASSAVPSQPLLPSPRRVTRTFPAPKEQLEDFVTVSMVLDPLGVAVPTPFQRQTLGVLTHLLVGTSPSPLYRALTESGLGKQVMGELEDGLKHLIFTAGLKGIPQQSAEDSSVVDKVEQIVLDCLEKHAREGFSEEAIEAAINSREFLLREFNTGTFPKGLAVIREMAALWTEDRDPVEGLRFEEHFEELRRRLKSGEPVFQNLLQKFFIGNPHRATIHLRADPDEEARREAQEKAEISALQASLSSEKLDFLEKQTKELKARQMAEDPPEALATLPTLSLEDVDKEGEEIPTSIEPFLDGRAAILRHVLPTSGILYADVAFPLHTLAVEDLQYLSLFSRLTVEAGTSTKDEATLIHHIGRYTGGILPVTDIRTLHEKQDEVADPYLSVGYFVLKGKVLKPHIHELFATMAEVMTDANLGNARRGREILKETLSSLEAAFLHSGHAVAASRILASLTTTGYISELRGGYAYLEFIKDLKKQADKDWAPIEAKLKSIRGKLLQAQREQLLVNLTGEADVLEKATSPSTAGGRALAAAVKAMRRDPPHSHSPHSSRHSHTLDGKRAVTPCPWGEELKKKRALVPTKDEGTVGEGFVIPTQVNYVGLGGRLFKPGEPFSGSTAVATRALSTGYIWDSVRVQGGAYGSSFRSDLTGIFLFTSYRDPHLRETLQKYLGAAEALRHFAETLDERARTRAILGVIRDLDQPTQNDQKGYRGLWEAIQGQSKEDRQRYRREVLGTSPEAIRAFAQRLEASLRGELRSRTLKEYTLDRERVADSSLPEDSFRARNLVTVVVGSRTAFDDAARQDADLVYSLRSVMGDVKPNAN
uniref:Peptidase M16 inactive domain-containing protein n=1 Tax=Toxoplasma gondii COUG TaxID=1074873 RepID=A0A2G8Y6W3_TOXGO|nr:peptidase M16 inactive domain-containing protein [Toxoplasma gondii COUG]